MVIWQAFVVLLSVITIWKPFLDIWDYHWNTYADASLLGCYTLSNGQ